METISESYVKIWGGQNAFKSRRVTINVSQS